MRIFIVTTGNDQPLDLEKETNFIEKFQGHVLYDELPFVDEQQIKEYKKKSPFIPDQYHDARFVKDLRSCLLFSDRENEGRYNYIVVTTNDYKIIDSIYLGRFRG
jgi:hypothetical protein